MNNDIEDMKYINEDELKIIQQADEIKLKIQNKKMYEWNQHIKNDMIYEYSLEIDKNKKCLNNLDETYEKKIKKILLDKQTKKILLENRINKLCTFITNASETIDKSTNCAHILINWSYNDSNCYDCTNERGAKCIYCGITYKESENEAKMYHLNNSVLNKDKHLSKFILLSKTN